MRYVNPWPRPLQQPHPPIWIPGAGSLETMEFCAKRRYAYMGIPYFHKRVFKRNFDFLREACAKEGYTPDPEQLGWLTPIYVADTDEQAWKEYEQHLFYFAHRLLEGITTAPPGYTSAKSVVRMVQARGDFMSNCKTRQDIEAGDFAIVGSVATVRQKMAELIESVRRRQHPRAAAARHAARRSDAPEHGAVQPRGAAVPAHAALPAKAAAA